MVRSVPVPACAALLLVLLPGCLDGDQEGGETVPGTAGCDAPLLPDRVRVREIDAATDPTDPNRLAVGLIASPPATRGQAPQDWPFWDALALSGDGGATWALAMLPDAPGDPPGGSPLAGSVFTTDPVVLFLSDGTLLYSGLNVRGADVELWVARLAPGSLAPDTIATVARGSLAPALAQAPSPYLVRYNDKQQLAEDPFTGDVYISWMWRTDDLLTGARASPVIARSTDGGATWGAPVVVLDDGGLVDQGGGFNVGAWPVVTEDDVLHAIWWDGGSSMLAASSTDQGATFSEPREIAAMSASFGGTNGVIQIGMPTVDIDRTGGPRHGTVYVAWEDDGAGDRDVLLTSSSDHVATWSAPVRVNDDEEGNGRDQMLPQLVVEPDGAVSVLYLDRRDDRDNWAYHATLARSTDGGITFTNTRLSSAPSDPRAIDNGEAGRDDDPLGRTRVGDYNGITWTRDGVLAVWQDGREGTADVPYSNAYACALRMR